jgi:hypothetical protein
MSNQNINTLLQELDFLMHGVAIVKVLRTPVWCVILVLGDMHDWNYSLTTAFF